ncbi:hypothetical protein GCM10018955_28870 [Planomonospora venezuelensis]
MSYLMRLGQAEIGHGRPGGRAHPSRGAPGPRGGAAQESLVPADFRFWQASTIRAAMEASAALPYERGS